MPSGITEADGMAYVGREPWHGLGTRVPGDAMKAAEALEAAGLDWTVRLDPVYREKVSTIQRDNEERLGLSSRLRFLNNITVVPDHQVVVREDNDSVLGMVGKRYTIAQNVTTFEFVDAIVGGGDAYYHPAGSLWGGRRVFLLVQLQGDYILDNGEALNSFILLDNSHDGSSALRMRLTKVRVVCQNTLDMASSGRAGFYARHTGGMMSRVVEARNLLGLNAAHMSRYMAECNMLAQEAWDNAQHETLVRDLFGIEGRHELNDHNGVTGAAARRVMELFHDGIGNAGETRWDAYNAITEFVDYHRPLRNRIESVDADDEETNTYRLENSWFARGGQRLRTRAWNHLTSG